MLVPELRAQLMTMLLVSCILICGFLRVMAVFSTSMKVSEAR